jgi:hypothetical protein
MVGRLNCTFAAIVWMAAPAPTFADDLYAQLFPVTGEIRLVNKGNTDIPFVFYSITSDADALDGTSPIWKSITENYDRPAGATPGNGLIDPNGDWLKLESDPDELTEGALDGDGGTLPASRAVSLGYIWDPYAVPFPDLVFEVWDDFEQIPITVELALDGDYSSDAVVDTADIIIWEKFLDSMTAYFADGDLDGVVDMDDYVIWHQNFGLTLPLPPYVIEAGGGGAGIANPVGVPEPSTAALLLLVAGAATVVRRPGR